MTADALVALVAALQQLQQQLMDKSDELHAEARKMKHFASQEYCDGKARGLQFSAQELSALLGRIREDSYEGRSPDGDGPAQPTSHRRETGATGTTSSNQWRGNDAEKPSPRHVGAGSEPADLHTKLTAPPLRADAPKDDEPQGPSPSEFDHRVWAERFVAHAKWKPTIPTDEDTMAAWFGTAIMAGYDEAKRRLTTSDPRVVAVMGSVPECAANGCQFRKTSGYRPGEHADFPLDPPIGSQLSIASSPPEFVLSINRPAGEPLVAIRPDGTLEYGADYTPDAAARVFWEAMASAMPKLPAPSSAAPQAPAGWQPIETAPKDGTPLLVAFEIRAGMGKGEMAVSESQWTERYWDGFHRPDEEQPAYWMPLPAPPLPASAPETP